LVVSAVDCRELTTVPHGTDTVDGKARPQAPKAVAARAALDPISRSWLEQLRPGHPRHHQTVAALHVMMRRMAVHELKRRHRQLPALIGPEFDDVAQQAADDALVNVLKRLDSFRGLSRFTTWAYRFVICEVSTKLAAHAWHRQPPSLDEHLWERLSGPARSGPEEALERHSQIRALGEAIGELSERQRRVFVSIALNDVRIDVLALELGASRNAIYKTLFDARQRLRTLMAAAGHPVSEIRAGASNDPLRALAGEC
jgi:RNA polymerase sigma-70 factor (ECF subfamily)